MRSSICVLVAVVLSSCGAVETGDPCQSLCGCSEDTTLSVSGNTFASDGTPAAGIKVSCKGERGAMDVTDSNGVFYFQYATQESPGCGYAGCNTLVFEDPAQRFASKELTVWQVRSVDGGVVLEP